MTYFIASSSSLPDSHALRRTASQEIDSSTPEILTSPVPEPVQTSFLLRHSKIAVTMEIYTEVPSAATRDALKKLSKWLDT
jgi:hypothetical protein